MCLVPGVAHFSLLTALSNQFQLLRLHGGDSYALDFAVGRLQDLEAQAVFLDCFALARNPTRELAHEPGDGRRFFAFRLRAEEFAEPVHIHAAGNNESPVAVTNDFRFIALIADFADDLLDQVFDGHQPRDAAVLVDNNRHAIVLPLHFAEQVASQLALRNEVNIAPHDGIQSTDVGFAVRHLQDVLSVNDPLDVMNAAFIYGNARVMVRAEHLNEALHGCVGGNREDCWTRLHRLPHGFAAELDYRLDEVTIALLNNAFFLAGLDQSIHGLR